MRRNILTIVVLFLTGAVASWGQSIEITPFVGYKFGGSVPVQSDKIDVNKIEFDDSVSAGINAGFNFTEHFGVEFMWSRQPTKAVGILPGGGEFSQKADVNLDQYFGHILYTFRDEDAKLRPFIFGGAGATRLSGMGSSETRFGFDLGGGVKYFFHPNIGARLQARWTPTYLYSTVGGVWCDWWGWCYTIPNDHYMNQGEVSAGVIFKF